MLELEFHTSSAIAVDSCSVIVYLFGNRFLALESEQDRDGRVAQRKVASRQKLKWLSRVTIGDLETNTTP
jgi:hypothetical protein